MKTFLLICVLWLIKAGPVLAQNAALTTSILRLENRQLSFLSVRTDGRFHWSAFMEKLPKGVQTLSFNAQKENYWTFNSIEQRFYFIDLQKQNYRADTSIEPWHKKDRPFPNNFSKAVFFDKYWVAYLPDSNQICVLDTESYEFRIAPNFMGKRFSALAYHPGLKLLVGVGPDSYLYYFDPESGVSERKGKMINLPGREKSGGNIWITSRGRILLSRMDGKKLYDLNTGTALAQEFEQRFDFSTSDGAFDWRLNHFDILHGTLLDYWVSFHSDRQMNVQWYGVNESGVIGHQLQSSADGSSWKNVRFKSSAGWQKTKAPYYHNDKYLKRRKLYYRLLTYTDRWAPLVSPSVMLDLDAPVLVAPELFVHPVNLISARFSTLIQVAGYKGKYLEWKLTDITGLEKGRGGLKVLHKNTAYPIALKGLSAGVYLMEVIVGGKHLKTPVMYYPEN